MSDLYLASDDELAELFRASKDAYSMSFAYAREFENRYRCEEDGWACHEEAWKAASVGKLPRKIAKNSKP